MSADGEDQPKDGTETPAPRLLRHRTYARWMGRGLTLSPKDLRRDAKRERLNPTEPPHERPPLPQLRLQCAEGERPCLFFRCKMNLYLDVTDGGGIKLNFPDTAPEDLEHTCALDAAEEGGMTLDHVASLMNLTRERVRQIIDIASKKLARATEELDNP